ncbi:LLM class flavin-dependent oxidoreductase [Rhodococcus sp. WS4]|nr:LLM class flavin-dependent oxidoreductase [Rhodococcus sp. WS4]
MSTPGHIVHGTWRRPTGRQVEFNDLDFWVELARTLERGKFESIFFADIIGLYNAYEGGTDAFVEAGVGIPSNDPSALVSALAYATDHLGVAFTASVVQEHPFSFARRISTLDHLTKGRVAWNIVTNVLSNAARNFGFDDLTEHDERYRWADEYVDVAYKLWEGSWEDDALAVDRESGVYAHPDKVHKINHEGPRYKVEGPHLVSPSPQRSPFLFQAGASPAGRAFAARNAEAVFLLSASPEQVAADIADIRGQAAAAGRNPEDLVFFQGLQFVVASTDEEARHKAAELDTWIDSYAQLAHMAGVANVDFGGLELNTPLHDVKADGLQSIIDWVKAGVTDREATLEDLGRYLATSNRLTGSPQTIADELQHWHDAGIDGVLVMNNEIPGTYDDFVDYVVPELQKRGLSQTEYRPGTLRQRILGKGDHLADTHPASAYRGAFTTPGSLDIRN